MPYMYPKNSNFTPNLQAGVESWATEQLTNLVRIYYKQEKLIHKSACTLDTRFQHYTRPTGHDFVEYILSHNPQPLDELNEAWFGHRTMSFGTTTAIGIMLSCKICLVQSKE